MTIGLVTLRLRLPGNQSLKGKRQVLLSLKTRLRQKFNVSVSEVDDHDRWQVATLAVASVGTDKENVNRTLSLLVEQVERERDAQLSDYELEFL